MYVMLAISQIESDENRFVAFRYEVIATVLKCTVFYTVVR